MPLTPRWVHLRTHATQQAYWHSRHRFNILPSGRRSGKTEMFKRKLCLAAFRGNPDGNARFFAGAPTRDQAKAIYWDDFKALVPPSITASVRETELVLQLVNGSSIHVLGMDKPERIEGRPWDGGGLDEYGNMREKTWSAHVRPALSDRLGWCDFIGVPEGRNHYYGLYQNALRAFQIDPVNSQWAVFHWPSADILPPEEIESARNDLDELTFRQEYGGEFVYFHGRAYHAFSLTDHVGRLEYRDHDPLILCFDFNAAPGVAGIVQEQKLPSGEYGTGIIGEVYIPRNSTTELVTRKILEDFGGHRGQVLAFGDATGGAKGSAKVQGSDWDLIRGLLQPHFGNRFVLQVPSTNPRERARVNAVNSRFRSTTGAVRCMVDARCPNIIADFEGVRLVEGGPGAIDKAGTPALTHLCFSGDTRIDTPRGPVALADLPKTGKVRAWTGDYAQYLEAGMTLKRAALLEVELMAYRRTGYGAATKRLRRSVFKATPWHEVLTTDGWRRVDELAPGALLVSWRCRLDALPAAGEAVAMRNARHTHEVTKITPMPWAPTYCLKVPVDGCFCLENGVIVSNSDAIGYYIAKMFPVSDTRLSSAPIVGYY